MKKIPFYNINYLSVLSFFFHISILLFIIPIVLTILWVDIIPFIFSVLYLFFALGMTIFIRRVYINTHQTSVPEEFANKLISFYRLLLLISYLVLTPILFFGTGEFILAVIIILITAGPWFLSCLLILPIVIKLILLKKIDFVLLGILLFLLLGSYFWSLYMFIRL